MSLPPVTTLPTLPSEIVTSTLDLLFEPSPALHALALPTLRDPANSFASYTDLIAALRKQLLALASYTEGDLPSRTTLHSILGSHPRLGEPKRESLSEQSRAEQRRLQEEGGQETAEKLARLNREYEARFPGLRYVVFVNGRGREEVMRDMERRIARGDGRTEEREAVEVGF